MADKNELSLMANSRSIALPAPGWVAEIVGCWFTSAIVPHDPSLAHSANQKLAERLIPGQD